MKKLFIVAFSFSLCVFGLNSAQAQSRGKANTSTLFVSLYTDLSPGKCKTIKNDKESGSSVQECPGVARYKLLVEDDDARMSITIVAPDGGKHPLNYWDVVTPAFSSIGYKAEWRVMRKDKDRIPVALIIRVNANENPDAKSKTKKVTSYLAVTKITPKEICVTDKIVSGKNANDRARRIADHSSTRPCLKQ